MVAVSHTPAHRTAEEIGLLPAAERYVAWANAKVDLDAKAALDMHPGPSHEQESELNLQLDLSWHAAKVLAATLPLFPAEKLERAPRPTCRRPGRRLGKRHGWFHDGAQWRCAKCLRTRVGGPGDPPSEGRCKGLPPLLHGLASRDFLGHAVQAVDLVVGGEDKLLYYCARCGAWAERRCLNLAKQCPGCAVRGTGGHDALRRLAKGMHPTASAHHKQVGHAHGELLRRASAAAAVPPAAGDEANMPRAALGQGSPEQRPAPARSSHAPPTAAQGVMAALRARIIAKEAGARAQAAQAGDAWPHG